MVGIVILNWNGLDDTLRCLESLQKAIPSTISSQIVVIDNGSTINPGDEIKRNFPGVDYVRLDTNVGYAGGSNLGAKRALAAGADFILFLNNDTIIDSDFLTPLIQSFNIERNLGVVSPLIYRAGTGDIEYSGGMINYAFGRFAPRHAPLREPAPLRWCDYASGCCMLVHRDTFQRVGLFDEFFFAYFEDTDFSTRARSAGLRVACRSDASVLHKGSSTTRSELTQGTTSPLKHYLVARNRLLLIRRHGSLVSRVFFLVVVQPCSIAYYLAGFALRFRVRKAYAYLSGIRDGLGDPNAKPRIDKWL